MPPHADGMQKIMNFDLAAAAGSRAVIVVEGMSDRVALETLAERRGLALGAQGISVVHLGGATNIGRFLDLFGPRGLGVRLAGLCDAAEEGHFRRALVRAGVGSPLSRADMEELGFYVCGADLEEELIRALGAAAVERVIQAQGELRSLRIFQQMPAWQGQSPDRQLHRFIGTRSGRKSLYARLLVSALDLTCVPRPLDRVLAHL
jgi:Overcoming lysogenization defect protein-like, TOPRIM domain